MDILSFFSWLVPPGNDGTLVFDIGANVGSYTRVFSKIGLVVAVEPVNTVFKKLQEDFETEHRVVLVNKAVGSKPGTSVIRLYDPEHDPLCSGSSMSDAFIGAVTSSERFDKIGNSGLPRWHESQGVEVTTLDALIAEFGVPDYIKIDVEGFEFEVIRGLSRPVKMVSFEFHPEVLDETLACMAYLKTLGLTRFSFTPGESFDLEPWQTDVELAQKLASFLGDNKLYGDVYAALP